MDAHTNSHSRSLILALGSFAALLHKSFFWQHHWAQRRKRKEGEETQGEKESRHSPGQAQPPTDIFSHVGLCSERNNCTQSARCSHGPTLKKTTQTEGRRDKRKWYKAGHVHHNYTPLSLSEAGSWQWCSSCIINRHIATQVGGKIREEWSRKKEPSRYVRLE